ncbi:MAG: polysaccharide pyruvyl transferase family protein [Actinomycetota bacterium]|nr:polysaccharide pyruvyl transferase family protein [Actinomycetota bacterium]
MSAAATARRVVVVNAAGLTNLGDDAIAAAVLADLRSTFPDATLLATGTTGEDGDPNVEPVGFDDGSIAEAIAEADLVAIGGGGFFFDYDARLTRAAFDRGEFFHLYPYVRAALTARSRSVPVLFYAIGVGPLVTPGGRELTYDGVSAASAVTVRDAASALELRRLNVTAPTPEVTADPAISLPVPEADWTERPSGRVIGFVARPWLRLQPSGTTPSGRAFFERYVECLAAAADAVIERLEATPVFLAAQTWNDDDLAVAHRVVRRMRFADRALVLPPIATYRELQVVLRSLDALVSTRLHPLILACAAGVAPVGVGLAGAKVRGFLASLGLPELAVSGWLGDTRGLSDRIERVLHDGDAIRARLAEGVAGQRRAAARNRAAAESVASAHGR